MPISSALRPSVPLAGLALVLAGCVGGIGDIAGLGGSDGDAEAPRQVQVTSDAVTILGPRGFCVDPTATQTSGDTGFVLLGNCAAISGSAGAAQPDVQAVLTAAVSAPSAGGGLTENLDVLQTFFRSDDGRALLSRSGDAQTVQILATRTQGDMFLLHARDTSSGAVGGVASDYWRAYMDIGARLATLSVLALETAEVSDDAALATLMQFATAVQGANTAMGAAQVPQEVNEALTPPFLPGLFQRIFQ